MLVLSRKIGERVKVGDDVYVTLLAIRGGRAIFGFEAEKTIPIYREELSEEAVASTTLCS